MTEVGGVVLNHPDTDRDELTLGILNSAISILRA